MDFKHSNSWFYLLPALLPILVQRRFTDVITTTMMVSAISGVLVHYYLHGTGTYFIPFDKHPEILVVLEALGCGFVQFIVVLVIRSLKMKKGMY